MKPVSPLPPSTATPHTAPSPSDSAGARHADPPGAGAGPTPAATRAATGDEKD